MGTQVGEQTDIQQFEVNGSKYAHIFAGILPVVDTLYIWSNNLDDLLTRPRVAIVGSRKITPYGRGVTEQFAGSLARQGIMIISGLAYGVDAAAHQAALDAGGLTIAVLPGSLSKIYPTRHTSLARRIVEQGGAVISEYPMGQDIAYKNQFIERNRIVCGMADALLITEAVVNSGTMHTARFALEQGKDVLAVPGNITSPASAGTNNLIKSGALPATSPADVLHVLGLDPLATTGPAAPAGMRTMRSGNPDEQLIINLVGHGIADGSQLLEQSGLAVEQYNRALTMLELTGKLRALGANQWGLIHND